jgi:hypothetical protein
VGALCLAELIGNGAQATVLTFEGLGSFQHPQGNIPNGYGGLNWFNLYYYNGPLLAPGSSADIGSVSGDYTALNGNLGAPASISGAVFDFDSAYLTAGIDPGAVVTVIGKRAGVPLYSQSIAIQPTRPTHVFFGFLGVDELDFSALGANRVFVMDDFTFSMGPEPSSIVLASLAIIGLAAVGWWKRRTASDYRARPAGSVTNSLFNTDERHGCLDWHLSAI